MHSIRNALALAVSLAAANLLAATPAAAEGAAAAPAGCTGRPSNTWIEVVGTGMRNDKGVLAITLYPDNSRRFLVKRGSLYVGRVKAQTGTTRGCIYVPSPGVYAIALYHDENNNLRFDRTGLGLPSEGYGFSNNPTTLAGLPSFSSVRLNIPHSGLVTRIRMKYP